MIDPVFGEMQTELDKFTQQVMHDRELEIFNKLKADKRLLPAVLVAPPETKQAFELMCTLSGHYFLPVLYSDVADGVYMVTNKEDMENVISTLSYL